MQGAVGLLIQYSQAILATLGIIALLWSFYTGWLPAKIRRMVGFHELKSDVDDVRENIEQVRMDHDETMDEIENLKNGQVALAEAVENEHDAVHVDRLRQAHFGEGGRPDDFLRGDN